MIKKSERLKLIIDLYARQEQEALQLLGRSQQKLLAQQSQLEQLQNYQIEHQTGFSMQQSKGLSMMQFMEMRAFADKLDKAIAGQKTVLAGFEQDFLRAQKNWEESHNRTKNMQKIRDSAKQDELNIEKKHEQTELDARAVRSQRKNGI